MNESQQSSDFLTDVQFNALNALYNGYLDAFWCLPKYMQDAYFLRAEKLGIHKT